MRKKTVKNISDTDLLQKLTLQADLRSQNEAGSLVQTFTDDNPQWLIGKGLALSNISVKNTKLVFINAN